MRETGNDDFELDPDDFVLDPRDIDLSGYYPGLFAEMEERFNAIAAEHRMTPDEYRRYRAMIAEAELVKSYVERHLQAEHELPP